MALQAVQKSGFVGPSLVHQPGAPSTNDSSNGSWGLEGLEIIGFLSKVKGKPPEPMIGQMAFKLRPTLSGESPRFGFLPPFLFPAGVCVCVLLLYGWFGGK